MPALPSAHQEYRKGRLAQHEMRDADPELVRAARECSEPGARTLYHHQGRAARSPSDPATMRPMYSRCGPDCRWNHLARTFVLSPARSA